MKIVMVTSELSPYSKTGGLADAVAGLSQELVALGHQVTCLVPYYRCSWEIAHAEATGMSLTVPLGQKQVTASIWENTPRQGPGEGTLRVVFVRRDEYFDRSELYGTAEHDYEDNAERFIFLSKVAVEWMRVRELYPDVVHAHDWQTALVPLMLRLDEQTHRMRIAMKTVFTIHNLAFQGIFWSLDFPMTNLQQQFFTPDGLEFYGQINLMKAGILFSDEITTVSRTYAREILTPEYGCGLENLLNSRADHLKGIRNGVDYEVWNPEGDPYIARRFSATDMTGKEECKRDLLRTVGLEADARTPVIGMISRLTDQKGFDIMTEALDGILKQDARLVLLGTGEAKHETFWRDAAKRHAKRVAARIAFDEVMAHKIEAGADMFLMPSRFEPCGMNQMYGLRYGTIPIVRATGGSDETVEDYDPQTGQGNGFKFRDHAPAAVVSAVERALRVYAEADAWKALQQNAMQCDFSWKTAAQEYLQLYQKG